MEIIKIEFDERSGREVAYMFDEIGYRVIKIFVKDYTKGEVEKLKRSLRLEVLEDDIEEPDRRPALRRPIKPVYDDMADEHESEDPHKLPGPLMDLPVKPKSIVPPDMRGLMVEHETPGSDVMTRKA